jgi:hypothetical protein
MKTYDVEISGINHRVFTYGRYGRKWGIQPDVRIWLEANCGHSFFYEELSNGRCWKFMKKEHALLFKLTWGGQ